MYLPFNRLSLASLFSTPLSAVSSPSMKGKDLHFKQHKRKFQNRYFPNLIPAHSLQIWIRHVNTNICLFVFFFCQFSWRTSPGLSIQPKILPEGSNANYAIGLKMSRLVAWSWHCCRAVTGLHPAFNFLDLWVDVIQTLPFPPETAACHNGDCE